MNPGFLDYQTRAHETAEPYERAVAGVVGAAATGWDADVAKMRGFLCLAYTTLGLAGEAGEIANKVKKVLRDSNGVITDEVRKDLAKELGDVLWYWSECCTVLNLSTADVAMLNIERLRDRKERGKLQGSGDNR